MTAAILKADKTAADRGIKAAVTHAVTLIRADQPDAAEAVLCAAGMVAEVLLGGDS